MVVDSPRPSVLNLGRNPNYWKTDASGVRLPYLDGLTIISSEERGLEVDLFASRSVDVLVVPKDVVWVEAVFEGPSEKVKEAVEWCHSGPPGSKVTDIDEKWSEYTGEFRDFGVKYSY